MNFVVVTGRRVDRPTPFVPAHAAELRRDPGSIIRRRTGRVPAWVSESIGSVVRPDRAVRELGWRAAHPFPLYALPT